jgi:hypothetical protein
MKTALFGFAASGKTELFKALAGEQGSHGSRAMVKVPEPRLDPLVELFQPRKVTSAEIEYLDLPGGGGKGSGLGQRVLSEIRPFDCLMAVLDSFSGLCDPDEQYEAIEDDLVIADLAVAEKRLERLELDKRKGKDLVDPNEERLLGRAAAHLEGGHPLRTDPELAFADVLRGFCFLSAKPIVYVWNVAENALETVPSRSGQQQAHIALSAKLERELAELEDPEERAGFLEDMGLSQSALDRVIAATFELLGLITFLTAGEKEVRAWNIPRGSTAPEAAGAVHSDLQKGFIRAEVLSWQDFLDCGTFKRAKERGVLRLEGKDYIVQDGDIITFRFNV